MLAPFKKIDLENLQTDKLQQNIDNFVRPLALNPLLDGVLIENIAFVSGVAHAIPHGLNRSFVGYFIVKTSGFLNLYDLNNGSFKPLFLAVMPNATVTASLWIF